MILPVLPPAELARLRDLWQRGPGTANTLAARWSMAPATLHALAHRHGWGRFGALRGAGDHAAAELQRRPLEFVEAVRIALLYGARVPEGATVALCPTGARGLPVVETWDEMRRADWRRAQARRRAVA